MLEESDEINGQSLDSRYEDSSSGRNDGVDVFHSISISANYIDANNSSDNDALYCCSKSRKLFSYKSSKSLSGSMSSVSTNTDPDDFLYARMISKHDSIPKIMVVDRPPCVITPRVIKKKVVNSNESENIATLDFQDIPFIDANDDSNNSSPYSPSKLVHKLKANTIGRLSKLCQRRQFKFSGLSRFRSLPDKLETRSNNSLLIGAGEREEENLPDLLNDCSSQTNLNLSDEDVVHSMESFEEKKCVTFSFPPQYFECSSFDDDDSDSSRFYYAQCLNNPRCATNSLQ